MNSIPIVIHNGITDLVNGFVDGVSAVSNLFTNIGSYCVDLLNGALSVFSKFVFASVDFLTKDIDNAEFADFWTVVNNVSRVLCIIASTLMVLLFLINMCTDAWDTRHDLDAFGFLKKCAKMLVSIVLVNNAVTIVTTIFKLGAKVAQVVTFGADTESAFYKTMKISDKQATYIEYGVSGFLGFLMWIPFFICALAIIVCGIIITFEVYSRIFKMFILIPFSTISFTTFVMGDGNRGNEVFHGYLKSILSIAMEAVIIMVFLSFTYSLISGETMEKLFPAMEIEATESIKVNGTELLLLASKISGDDTEANRLLNEYGDEIGSKVKDLVGGKGRDKAISKYGCIVTSSGQVIEGTGDGYSMLTLALSLDAQDSNSFTVQLYPSFTWKGVFMIILQILFPISLCTGAIKSVEKYSGMILGR